MTEEGSQSQPQWTKFSSILYFVVARFWTASYTNFSKVLGAKGYSASDRILDRYFGGGILTMLVVIGSIVFQIFFKRQNRTIKEIVRATFETQLLWVNIQRGLLQLVVTLGVIRSSDFLPVVILAALDFIDRPIISAVLSRAFREPVENIGLKIFALAGSLVAALYLLFQAPPSQLGAWGKGGVWELIAATALAIGAYQVKTGWTWGDLLGSVWRSLRRKESPEITERLEQKKEAAKQESKVTSLFYQTLTGVLAVLVVWVTFSRVLPRLDIADLLPLLGLMSAAVLLLLFDLAAKRGNVATLALYSVTVPIFGLFWDIVREGRLPERTSLVVAGILGLVAVVTTAGEYIASKSKRRS